MLRRILITVFVLIPCITHAKQTITWDFTNSQTPPGKWEVRKFTNTTPTDEGLVINTQEDGYMTTKKPFDRNVDAVTVFIKTNTTMEVIFFWKEFGGTEDGFRQLPFLVEAKPDVQEINVDMSTAYKWSAMTPEFGFALPAGANAVITRIELSRWNVFEKLRYGFLSFWKFDKFTPQAINFLWGPWLTFNPVAHESMLLKDPPLGYSGSWTLYLIFVISIIWCGVQIMRSKITRKKASVILATVFALLWLVFDLRMGSEILSFAKTDIRDYASKSLGERNLRNYLSFPDTAEEAIPILIQNPPYFFIGPTGKSLYFAGMRYFSYPDLPVSSGQKFEDATVGLVFGNHMARIDPEGNIVTEEGIVKKGPCEEIKRYRHYSFLAKCPK